jgi:hypothetical protein
MDLLDKWLKANIDPQPLSAEEQSESDKAKEEQVDTFCRLAQLKEGDK